ncbi:MRP-type ABC transporter [Trichoderma cornu-damae]|uniref:MRP-type ABC transporter n=1 Tax=Trichoderma cornu-damae TaxID=654480 RepID=A0A9P8TWA7_9HYPO|nr:MRP-type ABC transporter [Trichoderma cornu-damae]
MASHLDTFFFLSLSLATSLGFIVSASYRLWSLRHETVKLVASALPAVLLLGLTTALLDIHPGLRVATHSASVVASVGLVWLSTVEHKRSIRPSSLTVLYLLLTSVWNILALTYFDFFDFRYDHGRYIVIELVSRLAILALECQNKTSILAPKEYPARQSSPPSGEEAGRQESASGYFAVLDYKTGDDLDTAEAIFPRLSLIVFRCSQPILIQQAVQFVQGYTKQDDDGNVEYWLIVAAVVVYLGQTFAASTYYHRLNKLEIMMRGCLTTLIYNKALTIGSHVTDTGRVLTVMSTDVDGAADAGTMLHETWAKSFELAIGVTLLIREVKWLALLPFVIIFCKLTYVGARFLLSWCSNSHNPQFVLRQKNWNMATQRRISALSSILGSVKSVKALGVSGAMMTYIANALGIFAPVVTLVVFAIVARLQGSQMDVSTAFTTVAILALVTEPANMIMTIIPNAVATSANFERIQAYMLEPPQTDKRRVASQPADVPRTNATEVAVDIKGVTVESPTTKEILLHNIELTLHRGSTTTCSGAVGSGKSILAKAMLGEIVPSEGTVTVASTSIGFCDQQAWLPTGKVKQIICGFSASIDEERYETAVQACCLNHDLSTFPEGDSTIVGSRGINLSGGQRQRLALARLVYSLHDIAVLDDPFSALDGNTENAVVDNLLGPNGWFKKRNTAVFLVTNSAQHFHLADEILILEKGRIASRGSWDELKSSVSELSKFTFTEATKRPEAVLQVVRRTSQSDTDAERDVYRKTGDFSLYSYYLNSAGAANYWLKSWTEGPSSQSTYYMIGYVLLAFVAWVATNGMMFTEVWRQAAPISSWDHIWVKVKSGNFEGEDAKSPSAPLAFFSTTDIGVIINRFSQDISYADRQLPSALSTTCTQVFKMANQLVLIVSVQKGLALSLPVCAVAVYLIQRIYLRTSRQLRALEIENHSALYQWFLETAEGVVTIRSFGWSSAAEEKSLDALNWSLQPRYALLCVQRWLSLVLNLIGTTTGGDIGVALNLIMVANTTLVRLVEAWASLEVSLGAIARLRSVQLHTPREDLPEEDLVTCAGWPTKGEVHIAALDAGYRQAKNLSSAVELEVKVDGQDLLRTPRSTIRQRCFITISQEPFLIPQATLRFNLDPYSIVTDEILEMALLKVDIWSLLSGRGGTSAEVLDSEFSSLPVLSVGQQQLLAMARAIVCKYALAQTSYHGIDTPKPILLLDEATSSLDSATEAAIYDVLESEFIQAGYTAIIVAHRLSVVAGRMRPEKDKVAWIEDGRVVKAGEYEEIVRFADAE